MNGTSQPMHVLIAGAGIAGMSLAYWLNRYGIRTTIVEKASALPAGGYRVGIRGAAWQVAEAMELAPQIEAYAAQLQGSSLINRNGKRVVNFKDPHCPDVQRAQGVELTRGDLARILFKATTEQTAYIFGNSIENIVETSDGIVAFFSDGAEQSYDLIIGAEGLHSDVRRLTFADDEQLVQDLGYYMATFRLPNYFNLEHWELCYPSSHKVIQVYNDRRKKTARAMLLFPRRGEPAISKEMQQQLAEDAFADAGWETERLLEAMHDATDFYCAPVSQVSMDELYRGRVALLGDAGYAPSPASGQGTSMALVGAYILAGELKRTGTNHLAAFRSYEEQMFPFIARNQQLAHRVLQEMVPRSDRQIRYRALMMRLRMRIPGRRAAIRRMLQQMQAALDQAANGILLQPYHLAI